MNDSAEGTRQKAAHTTASTIGALWAAGYSADVIARCLQLRRDDVVHQATSLPARKEAKALHWKAYESTYGSLVVFAPTKDDVHRLVGGGERRSWSGEQKGFRVSSDLARNQFVLLPQMSELGRIAAFGQGRCGVCRQTLMASPGGSAVPVAPVGERFACRKGDGSEPLGRVGVESIVCDDCWTAYEPGIRDKEQKRLGRLTAAAARAGLPPEDGLQRFMRKHGFAQKYVWVALHEGTMKAAENPWSRVYHRVEGIEGKNVELCIVLDGYRTKHGSHCQISLKTLKQLMADGMVVGADETPIYKTALDRFCEERGINPAGFKVRVKEGDMNVLAIVDGNVIGRIVGTRKEFRQISMEQFERLLGRGQTVQLPTIRVLRNGRADRYPTGDEPECRVLGRLMLQAGWKPATATGEESREDLISSGRKYWRTIARLASYVGRSEWAQAVRENARLLSGSKDPEVLGAASYLLHSMTIASSHVLAKTPQSAIHSDLSEDYVDEVLDAVADAEADAESALAEAGRVGSKLGFRRAFV